MAIVDKWWNFNKMINFANLLCVSHGVVPSFRGVWGNCRFSKYTQVVNRSVTLSNFLCDQVLGENTQCLSIKNDR